MVRANATQVHDTLGITPFIGIVRVIVIVDIVVVVIVISITGTSRHTSTMNCMTFFVITIIDF